MVNSARLARKSGSSFYYAFRVLPRRKREVIYALYSFCRTVDDCVDDERGEGETGLDFWVAEIDRCFAGRPQTDLGTDLARAIERFPIPRSCFEQIIAGCRMDLAITRYRSFEDLRGYCSKVASAVGLASIEVFGYTHPQTREYAVELGLALQLTNILRDVPHDARRGRLYLPLEDLKRFGVSEEELMNAPSLSASGRSKEATALLAFEAERAREHYERARLLLPPEDRRAMLCAEIMGAIYRSLLEELVQRGYPWTEPALRLSRLKKARIVVRTLWRSYKERLVKKNAPRRLLAQEVLGTRRIVVIGGGFAGLAAAIALQERRHVVTLLERRGVLGGRATSYADALYGEDVDNGTHLMVGAYAATLDLIHRARADRLLLMQEALRIDYVDDRGFTSLRCAELAPPFHLITGLLSLRLPWSSRFRAARLDLAVRFGSPPTGLTLAEYFKRTGQGAQERKLLWDPLATAILNETPERAAAILFYNVYRAVFLADRRASCLIFLRSGYREIHARLGSYFEDRGGVIRRRAQARSILVRDGRVKGVRYIQQPNEREEIQDGRAGTEEEIEADVVVAAVPWSAVASLVPENLRSAPPFEGLSRIGGTPIVSIEMWLDQRVVDRVMVGLRDCEVDWVFDKGRLFGREGPPQHLAFIVSAAHRSVARPNADLVAMAESALRRYFPSMAKATVVRSLVLREAAATFCCDPETEALRPGPMTPLGGLLLAGDWTKTGLPATIEGAVRSGFEAARCVEVTQ